MQTRRGNYAVLFALAILAVLGFGALAIDISYMRMAQSQSQDVADAASQAALLILRRTGDRTEAAEAAQKVAALNEVAGRTAKIQSLEFGVWDQGDSVTGTFTVTTGRANAVRVVAGPGGGTPLASLLGGIFGLHSFEVRASSTSALRNLQVILAMDITNSWNPNNFQFARQAAVQFLDTMRSGYGPRDKIGMTVFTNRYGWEFTKLTQLNDGAKVDAVRIAWSDMKTASKAGWGDWPNGCALHGNNDFSWPAGGCWSNMPREYTDEPGTDHTTGMGLAWEMFAEQTDPSAVRVMVVLTDGQPASIGSTSGTARAAAGYKETRWREYVGPAPHSSTDIRWDSIQMTHDMWSALRVHTYVVSFVADDWFMHEMPQGQGYYVLTTNAAHLVTIFEEIANSLPMALVE